MMDETANLRPPYILSVDGTKDSPTERELIAELTYSLAEVLRNTPPVAMKVSESRYFGMRSRAMSIVKAGQTYIQQPGRDHTSLRFIVGVASLTTAYDCVAYMALKMIIAPVSSWPVLAYALLLASACIFISERCLRGIQNYLEMRQQVRAMRATYLQLFKATKAGDIDEAQFEAESRKLLEQAGRFIPIKDGEKIDAYRY